MGSLGTSEGKPSAEQVLSQRGTDPFGVRGLCFPLVGGKVQRLRPHLPGTELGSDPLPIFTHPGDSGEAEAAPPPTTPCQLCLWIAGSSRPWRWPCSRLLRGEAHPAPRFPDSPSPLARGPDGARFSTHPLPPSWLRGRELMECGQTGLTPGKGQGFPLPSPPTPYLPVSGTAGPCWPVRRPDFPHPLISCKLHTLTGRPGPLPPGSRV